MTFLPQGKVGWPDDVEPVLGRTWFLPDFCLGNLLTYIYVFRNQARGTARLVGPSTSSTTSTTFNTLAARGLDEPCASFPDFCDNRHFHVIYCVYSRLCTLFRQ